MRSKIHAFLSSVLLSSCLLGCSDGRPTLAPVSGTVTYQGQPIAVGTIVFEVEGSRPANGRIVDGTIVDVFTYEPGDGAPTGNAKIAVFAQGGSTSVSTTASASTSATPATPATSSVPKKGYMDAGAPSLIPNKYNNPATSDLKHEIVAGENVLKLELK